MFQTCMGICDDLPACGRGQLLCFSRLCVARRWVVESRLSSAYRYSAAFSPPPPSLAGGGGASCCGAALEPCSFTACGTYACRCFRCHWRLQAACLGRGWLCAAVRLSCQVVSVVRRFVFSPWRFCCFWWHWSFTTVCVWPALADGTSVSRHLWAACLRLRPAYDRYVKYTKRNKEKWRK